MITPYIYSVKPHQQQTLIMTSVCFFLVPGFYGIYHERYVMGICSFTSGIASITYWSDPRSTDRHKFDIIVSRMSAFIYSCIAFYYGSILSFYYYLVNIGFVICICGSYYMSRRFYNDENDAWLYSHVLLHISMFLASIFVYVLAENYKIYGPQQ